MAALATLSICSLASYGVHVLMHKVPLLWKVHRVHHLDTHLDVSTTLRSHPLEIAVKLVVLVPVSIAFGLTLIVVITYQIVEALVEAFSHANVNLPHSLDRSLRWLLVTPNMHSIHVAGWEYRHHCTTLRTLRCTRRNRVVQLGLSAGRPIPARSNLA